MKLKSRFKQWKIVFIKKYNLCQFLRNVYFLYFIWCLSLPCLYFRFPRQTIFEHAMKKYLWVSDILLLTMKNSELWFKTTRINIKNMFSFRGNDFGVKDRLSMKLSWKNNDILWQSISKGEKIKICHLL